MLVKNFNPHFRKGSDGQDIDWTATEDDISIHTSAREVTAKVRVRIMPKPISIHTSAREVTCSLDHWMHRKPYFNPHFRKGSDHMGNSYIKNMVISIHTSAREVTQSNSICSRIVPDFNPHFRKGSDFEKSAGEDYMFRISIHGARI